MALRITVLVSGTGTNLKSIVHAIEKDQCDAQVVGVISDRPNVGALEFAKEKKFQTQVVAFKKFENRETWSEELAKVVKETKPDLVVLAGFMRIVSPVFIRAFKGKIINVHPALLPSFPGKDGPAQAIEAKVRISGCTVHVVDEGVDTGPIIAQCAVPVFPMDDVEALHKRIQKQEHQILPAVIDWIGQKWIEIHPAVRYQKSFEHMAKSTIWAPNFKET